jgi:hypothetical protein
MYFFFTFSNEHAHVAKQGSYEIRDVSGGGQLGQVRPFSPDPPTRNRLPPAAPDRNSTTVQVSLVMLFLNKLARAAAGGDDEEVERLLAAGQSPNDAGILGSPIHEASRRGRLACVKLLCRARADIKQRDAVTSETPLHCAVVFGHVQVARILVEAGCDLNAQDLAGGVFPPARSRPTTPHGPPPLPVQLPRALACALLAVLSRVSGVGGVQKPG